MSYPVERPTVYNIELTNADTEYSQLLPSGTRELRFRCRDETVDVRFAFETGKVATPTAPYLTLPAGCEYHSDENDLTGLSVYFASDNGQDLPVVELEVWTL